MGYFCPLLCPILRISLAKAKRQQPPHLDLDSHRQAVVDAGVVGRVGHTRDSVGLTLEGATRESEEFSWKVNAVYTKKALCWS